MMDYLPQVIMLVKQTGKLLSSHFYSAFSHSVTIKSDQSPVTQADIAANKMITEKLTQLDATIPILSEENNMPDFAIRQQWKKYWLIDPLDGTRGFIKRSADFCINIALIENDEPILGVIYAPISKELCFAAKNRGAFFIDPKNELTQSIATSKKTTYPLRFLTGHSGQAAKLLERKKLLEEKFGKMQLTEMNSALKFSQIARGLADVYVRFGPTSEWDTAAGQCIVCEAGGTVVDFQGKPLHYNAKSSLINPSFIALGDAENLNKFL